jgi:uncharacterized protein (TIGR03437 family)
MKFACCWLFLAFNLVGQNQLPAITKVSNFGAGGALSPAAYAFVSGTNFGTAPIVSLGAAQCPLLYTSDTFVSFQVPVSTATGASTVTIQTAAGAAVPFALTITPTSPVIVNRDLILAQLHSIR